MSKILFKPWVIKVALRDSLLSQKQLTELQQKLQNTCPQVQLQPVFTKTYGDLDQKTSLKLLDRTDFFTREVDLLVQQGKARIALHSAKDLPKTLPGGLTQIALTETISPFDSLVLRPGLSYTNIPANITIGVSSLRREMLIKKWIPTAKFVDIRGTVEKRLQLLQKLDGVVIAEAALLRLSYCGIRWVLQEKAAPLQGQLAVLAKQNDKEIQQVFQKIATAA